MRIRPSLLALLGCAMLSGCGGSAADRRNTVWQALPMGTDAEFQDVWFADTLNGWAVGGAYDIDGGLIGKTRDGGRTWTFASKFVSRWPGESRFSFTGVQFFDSLSGCTVASGGQIFLTDDGGETWRLARHGAGESLSGLHFIDRFRGWAVGGTGVLTTIDGGENWHWAIRSNSENGYISGNAVHFLDGSNGWMATHHSGVLRTSDGGTIWTAVKLPLSQGENPNLFDVEFVDWNHGWVVGENGTILATTDAGQTWTRQSNGIPAPKPRPLHIVRRQNGIDTFDIEGPPPGLFLTAVRFLDAERGWTIGFFPTEGRSVVLRTDDGGATWTEEGDAPGEELRGLFVTPEGRAWAVGDRVREGTQALLFRAPTAL